MVQPALCAASALCEDLSDKVNVRKCYVNLDNRSYSTGETSCSTNSESCNVFDLTDFGIVVKVSTLQRYLWLLSCETVLSGVEQLKVLATLYAYVYTNILRIEKATWWHRDEYVGFDNIKKLAKETRKMYCKDAHPRRIAARNVDRTVPSIE